MRDLAKEALDLVNKLQIESGLISAEKTLGEHGVSLGVYISDDTISFFHNFSISNKPKKKVAIEILFEIEEYYLRLKSESKKFKEFVSDYSVQGELVVFSGHFDIFIAKIIDGEIIWEYNLEE